MSCAWHQQVPQQAQSDLALAQHLSGVRPGPCIATSPHMEHQLVQANETDLTRGRVRVRHGSRIQKLHHFWEMTDNVKFMASFLPHSNMSDIGKNRAARRRDDRNGMEWAPDGHSHNVVLNGLCPLCSERALTVVNRRKYGSLPFVACAPWAYFGCGMEASRTHGT